MKRILLTIVSVFVTWSIMDLIIHGVILSRSYQETSQLWRPMEEMKTGLIYLTGLIIASVFVYIYSRLIKEKSMAGAVTYGLLFGIAFGVSMGYGSYAVMPIPYKMALIWFAGSMVEKTAGGLLLGLIIRE